MDNRFIPFKVYLSGPINDCEDSECIDWREKATSLLLCETLDPMVRDNRKVEITPAIAKYIVESDKEDIRDSDAIIVYYTRPSVGTSMEIMHAFDNYDQFVVLVNPLNLFLSPWSSYHVDKIVDTIEEAVNCIHHEFRLGEYSESPE